MLANLVAGSILVVVTVIIHGLGLLALSATLRSITGRYRPQETLAGTVVVMVATVLGLFLLHTVEIWTWALAYLFVGALPDMESALFFSTLSFSTLGAEAISAAPQWQLFGSFEGRQRLPADRLVDRLSHPGLDPLRPLPRRAGFLSEIALSRPRRRSP